MSGIIQRLLGSPVGHLVTRSPGHLVISSRVRYAMLAFTCALPIIIAAFLHPDARGFGAHEQLWLPPCNFRMWTGIPCPFCGMTTAFTRFAHGDVAGAIYVQPIGCIAFVLCAIASAWALICCFKGSQWEDLRRRPWWRTAEKGAIVVVFAGWIFKLWIS